MGSRDERRAKKESDVKVFQHRPSHRHTLNHFEDLKKEKKCTNEVRRSLLRLEVRVNEIKSKILHGYDRG